MNVVMLSGGSGQRLWPLSNNVRSKQFLKLLKNDQGNLESMVQRVFRQLNESGIESQVVIATSDNQVDSVKAQLGDQVEVVVEPERRDTFPAIALSIAHLYFNKKVDKEETVVIMPVDPYTSIEFFHKIEELSHVIDTTDFNLGLLAIKPTYASSKYGYILNDGNKVTGFVEKPSEETAAEIIQEGAYWNGGVFVVKIKYILNILDQYIQYNTYQDVLNQYANLPKNSFDYEVSEKEQRITMVKYEGDWKDLGTWKTLTEEMDTITVGEVILSEDSQDTHVINELDIPITVIGADNIVVAASQDGILVSDKVKSAQLKKYIKTSYTTAMYEETYYGHRKIVDIHQCEAGTESQTSLVNMNSGFTYAYKFDDANHYAITVLEGLAKVTDNKGDITTLKSGSMFSMSDEGPYEMESLSDLTFLEVKSMV